MYKKSYYVYIATNYIRSVFYTGFTNNLIRRIAEHKQGLIKGFTKKYQVKFLLFFEETPDVYSAITREKQIKSWGREKKLRLIKEKNPFLLSLQVS